MPRLRFLRPPPDNDPLVFLATNAFELVVVFVATKKQRSVLTAVLVLGAGAIGWDQFMAGAAGPQPARADDLLVASEKSPGAAVVVSAAVPTGGAHIKSVAQMLSVLPATWDTQSPASDADGFALPAHWVDKIVAKSAPEGGTSKEAQDATTEPELHLTMIVRKAKEAPVAIINGEAVRVGESVQGYTLISLRAPGEGGPGANGFALLEGPSGLKELSFDPVGPSNTRGRGSAKQ